MEDIADLLRELIDEIKELKEEVSSLKGPLGYSIQDLHETLSEVDGKLFMMPSTISDALTDHLGGHSVYNIGDIHAELVKIGDLIEDNS